MSSIGAVRGPDVSRVFPPPGLIWFFQQARPPATFDVKELSDPSPKPGASVERGRPAAGRKGEPHGGITVPRKTDSESPAPAGVRFPHVAPKSPLGSVVPRRGSGRTIPVLPSLARTSASRRDGEDLPP